MDVITRKVPPTAFRGTRVSVSNGAGVTADYPWSAELDDRENHLWSALVFAREQFGFAPAVVREASPRPKADGFNVTLSRYTEA